MIDLTLPCTLDGTYTEPFVTKLENGLRHHADGGSKLVPSRGRDEFIQWRFSTPHGEVYVAQGSDGSPEGDVVLIEPTSKRLHRWLRPGSAHNTLLITERCDQLCIMCSQPPRKTHIDLFDQFEEACLLADQGAHIGFSGGEPTLYKDQLFLLLDSVTQARPDLSFHILTNAQHFEENDRARISTFAEHVIWGVPVYSKSAAQHDEIVGKAGSFFRLEESLSILIRAGASIELRTVVMQQNVDGLADLARWVSSRLTAIDCWAIMQLERQGFAKNRWDTQFLDHSISFKTIGDAVVLAMARGIDVWLYNMPRCTVPEHFRLLAPSTISDWKRDFPPKCARCKEKHLCSGLFAWHGGSNPYANWGPL